MMRQEAPVAQAQPAHRGPATARRPPLRRTLAAVGDAAVFLAPKLILFVAFVLVPFGYTFVLMFQAGTVLQGFRFIGLDNFETIVRDRLFFQTLKNTLVYMAIIIPLVLTVPLAIALLLASSIVGVRFYRTLIYIPSLLSIVATSLIWKVMLHPDVGPLPLIFNRGLGLNVPWLSNGMFALVLVALISLWHSLGFYSIIFMAGLNDIPTSLFEAARIDGASSWDIFWRIKLPLLKTVIQLVLVLVTINSVQVFDIIYVMTQGGPGTSTYTVMWYIFQNVFNNGSVGYAAAMGVVVLILTLLVALVYLRTIRMDEGME